MSSTPYPFDDFLRATAILNVEHKSRQLGIEVAVARSREGQC